MRVEIVRTHEFDIASLVSRSREKHIAYAVEITQDFVKRSSVVWVGKADGVEVCAIGLIPVSVLSDHALLWLTHTDVCEAHPLRFIRWSQRVLREAQGLYPVLFGYCVNVRSQAWLEWLGAEFSGQTFRIVKHG